MKLLAIFLLLTASLSAADFTITISLPDAPAKQGTLRYPTNAVNGAIVKK